MNVDKTTLDQPFKLPEYYNKHYIEVDDQGRIIDLWSDGPHPEKDATNAVCINERGSYQVYLTINGERTEDNPRWMDMDGIPLYKYEDGQVLPRTKEERKAEFKAREQAIASSPVASPTQKDIMTMMLLQAQSLPKKQALKVKSMYPVWGPGISYTKGQRVLIHHGGIMGDRLYEARQDHTSQEDYNPLITPALWEYLDESHQGTFNDPIPATINITYYKGKYYSEEGGLYLCIRDSEIPLAFMPSDLVGNYFEKVE